MGLPTTPGAIIGYRKSGHPIHLIAGGSEAAAEQGNDGGQGQAPESTEDAQAQQLLADAAKESQEKDGGKAAPEKVEDLPEWAQKVIKDARKGEGDKRAALREAESKASEAENRYQQTMDGIAKALGYKQDDDAPPDPEEMAKQLTAKDEQLTKAQEAERSARRQSVAERAMHKHGADVEQMSDSKKFAEKLAALDPDGENFTSDLDDLVKTTLNDNPKYKASQAPAASSGDFSSGPGERKQRPSSLYDAVRSTLG